MTEFRKKQGKGYAPTETEWARIREDYMNNPRATLVELGKAYGLGKSSISQRANDPRDPWVRPSTMTQVNSLANQLVDSSMTERRERMIPRQMMIVAPKMPAKAIMDALVDARSAKLADPVTISAAPPAHVPDAPGSDPDTLPSATPVPIRSGDLPKVRSASDGSVEEATRVAVEIRAQVIDRHRREWGAVRQLSYEAIKTKDMLQAKMAKATAETFAIIQKGERVAFGMDAAEGTVAGDKNSNVIVIDRS